MFWDVLVGGSFFNEKRKLTETLRPLSLSTGHGLNNVYNIEYNLKYKAVGKNWSAALALAVVHRCASSRDWGQYQLYGHIIDTCSRYDQQAIRHCN